ncbi:hypothetical protein V5799_022558 [Amblyomma americanum]|uniref:Uncharacterized protein n=1 Tax=Amblyomma americanum TaxID=6943 RepID=A0AAQ4FK63_AMBAM
MEVVEGDEVDPLEFTAPGQWFQCRGKKVVPLEKSRREIEAEQFRLRQAGRKLAAFSVEKQEAQIPEGADKIILRPKGGLDRLLKRGPAYLTRMIKAWAGVNIQETEEEDIVIPNTKQHSILIATTSGERKMQYVGINLIKLGEEEEVPVFAYVATPDGCGKRVVHGVDRIFTQEEIMQMLRHKANSEIIGATTTTTSDDPNHTRILDCAKWDYDPEQERRSIVSRWDLVCHRRPHLALAHAVYIAGSLIFMSFVGLIADRVGRLPLLLSTVAALQLATLGGCFSASYHVYELSRFLNSGCTATATVLSSTLLFEASTHAHRSLHLYTVMAMGMLTAEGWFAIMRLLRHLDWITMQSLILSPMDLTLYAFIVALQSPRSYIANKGLRCRNGDAWRS